MKASTERLKNTAWFHEDHDLSRTTLHGAFVVEALIAHGLMPNRDFAYDDRYVTVNLYPACPDAALAEKLRRLGFCEEDNECSWALRLS